MFIKKAILVISLALAFPIFGKCQCITINLIENPSMEEYTSCPTSCCMINSANYWTQPVISGSTSEYFNSCGIDSVLNDPVLLKLFQNAFFGEGYSGIRIWGENQSLREYIQGALSEPLGSNKCYYCEFWVKLYSPPYPSLYPFAAIDAISIFFSDTLLKTTAGIPIYLNPQINNPSGNILSDTSNWVKIRGYFNAIGGEKYFTVGNFKQEYEINKLYFGTPPTKLSYYFFDNFSLCPCEDTIPPAEPEPVVYIPNVFSPNGDEQNDVFRVRGVNIETLQLTVYNRWGEKVFESQNKNDGWDGSYKGKPCSPDVYVYHAAIVFEDGMETSRKGNVTLVR